MSRRTQGKKQRSKAEEQRLREERAAREALIAATPNAAQLDRAEKLIISVSRAEIKACKECMLDTMPLTSDERRNRYYYAIVSANMGWSPNCNMYVAITKQPWKTEEELAELLKATRAGLYNTKAEYICSFRDYYNRSKILDNGMRLAVAGPREAGRKDDWVGHRDRMAELKEYKGADLKVASFQLELCHPGKAKVLTIDRHVWSWFGIPSNLQTPAVYHRVEQWWLEKCAAQRMPPDLVRHVLYDREQSYEEPVHWTYPFEQGEVLEEEEAVA